MNYLHFASQDDGQSLSETSAYMPRLMGDALQTGRCRLSIFATVSTCGGAISGTTWSGSRIRAGTM